MRAILSIDCLDTCEATDGSLHTFICHRQLVSIPALPHCTHACVMFVEISIVYNFNETHSGANSQAMVRWPSGRYV